MKRNSIIFSLLAILVIVISVLIGGFDLFVFYDLISLGIVIVIPILLILGQYKISEVTETIKLCFRKKIDNIDDIKYLKIFFKSINKYTVISGVAGTLYGIIGMLYLGYENIDSFFKGLSASFLTILYALILCGFVYMPIIGRFEKKLIDFSK